MGDVPPNDPSLLADTDADDDDHDKRHLSDDDEDEDEVLEVDSPDHSPVRRSSSPLSLNLSHDEDAGASSSGLSHRSLALHGKPSSAATSTLSSSSSLKALSNKMALMRDRSFDRDTDNSLDQHDEINVDSNDEPHHRRRRSLVEKLDSGAPATSDGHCNAMGSMMAGGASASEVTHCHHEGLIGPHYTMRPYYDYYSPLSLAAVAAAHNNSKMSSSPGSQSSIKSSSASSGSAVSAAKPENFVPMLHVRRDLHHKSPMISGHSSATVTSSAAVTMSDVPGPSFLGSIPIRKRPMGPNGEPQILIPSPTTAAAPSTPGSSSSSTSPHFHSPMHHHLATSSGHHPFNVHHSPSSSSCSPSSQSSSKVNKGKEESGQGGKPQQAPVPKKTGFSIEDIMRR